mmetsp:Transcript_1907/g.4463  ORF Transcript_1907/g.4463 Transcript_1907/m.4463 type:complete len:412 (-) Transcript_1907:170-1405(-)
MSRSTQKSVIKAVCLFCILHHVCEAFTSTSGPASFHQNRIENAQCFDSKEPQRISTFLSSSFYDDFEDFEFSKGDENGNDDDDEDEYAEMDERSIAEFKSKMSNMFDDDSSSDGDGSGKVLGTVEDLINFARQTESAESTESTTETLPLDWAKPTTEIRPGTVLVANPSKFCAEGDYGAGSEPSGGGKDFFASALGRTGPAPSLLAKFGLTQPPPRHLGADRQADLLPVVIVVSVDGGQVQGVLLNRRTGYLLGDLEQPSEDGASDEDMAPILEKFCIQPLWFGGIDSLSVGLDMLHLCPTVNDATQITEDGMFWGGDPTQAQDAMEDPSLDRIYSGFDFKFFVQSTIWSNAGQLQSEIDQQVWFPASVSQNILFKSRDRMGTKKAKPLWTEIMDLMGNEYAETTKNFYIE